MLGVWCCLDHLSICPGSAGRWPFEQPPLSCGLVLHHNGICLCPDNRAFAQGTALETVAMLIAACPRCCHLYGGGRRPAGPSNLKWQRLTFRAAQQKDFHFPEP